MIIKCPNCKKETEKALDDSGYDSCFCGNLIFLNMKSSTVYLLMYEVIIDSIKYRLSSCYSYTDDFKNIKLYATNISKYIFHENDDMHTDNIYINNTDILDFSHDELINKIKQAIKCEIIN